MSRIAERLPSLPPLSAGTVQLVPFGLAAAPAGLPVMLAMLDEEERARADRFRFERDRTAFTVAHAAVRHLLGQHRGCSPAALDLVHVEGEKPVFRDGAGPHFSLSHSAGTGLIGIAAAPLGVDVEAVRLLTDRDAIARRYFARQEADAILALPEAARHEAFFACWTRKEAYIKARGLGLSIPLDSFEVDIGSETPTMRAIDGDATAAARWSLWSRRAGTAWYAAAIANPRAHFLVYEASVPMQIQDKTGRAVSST